MQPSKRRLRSITLSARSRIEVGSVTPIALEVLTLMANFELRLADSRHVRSMV
jgi:hypothetical protein